jgi:RNA polymerase sigma-70 factor (ECF subfamily)
VIAFAELYQRHSRDVYRFVFWLSGNPVDAEELTAETFARAWAGADSLRLETVKAYLIAIARNLYLEQRRRARPEEPLAAELVDGTPDPEREAIGRDRLSRLRSALQSLSEVDRAALLMRCEDGLSYADIARALGLSLSAAKVKVHRSRLRLAALMDGAQSAPEIRR